MTKAIFSSDKQPFDIETAIVLLRAAPAPYPRAALFELYTEGYTSVFEMLWSLVLSRPRFLKPAACTLPRRSDT